MDDKLRDDLKSIFQAVDKVLSAARAETIAFDRAIGVQPDPATKALYEVHLGELDAIHILVARVDLFRRQFPDA